MHQRYFLNSFAVVIYKNERNTTGNSEKVVQPCLELSLYPS